MTVSGCTRAALVRVHEPKNGLTRPMLSWNGHLQGLKELVSLGVPVANVQTRVSKPSWLWVNIFARMDLRQTIPGGSTMVKPIVGEMRS